MSDRPLEKILRGPCYLLVVDKSPGPNEPEVPELLALGHGPMECNPIVLYNCRRELLEVTPETFNRGLDRERWRLLRVRVSLADEDGADPQEPEAL